MKGFIHDKVIYDNFPKTLIGMEELYIIIKINIY